MIGTKKQSGGKHWERKVETKKEKNVPGSHYQNKTISLLMHISNSTFYPYHHDYFDVLLHPFSLMPTLNFDKVEIG